MEAIALLPQRNILSSLVMSFGWSPSDIANLAKLCYEIYNFCRTAPAELQGLSDRLDKMGRKLERLSAILDKSGLGTWKQAPALEQHLLDARALLEPLLSVTDNSTFALSKAKGLARLAIKKGRLRLIEKNLDMNEREIDELKVDLILTCSLRNMHFDNDLHLGLFHPQPPLRPTNKTLHLIDEILPASVMTSTVPLSLEANRSSITSTTVSNASKALIMAMRLRSRPSSEAEAVAISDTPPEGSLRIVQMTDDFVVDVLSLAEETELYAKDADPTKILEQLTEITERATHFRLALHSSSADSRTSTVQYQLPAPGGISPDSFEGEFFGHLSSTSDNRSTRMWALDRIQTSRSGPSHNSAMEHSVPPTSCSNRKSSSGLPLQDCSGDEDSIFQMSIASMADAVIPSDNEPSTKHPISLHGRSKVSLTMNPKASVGCSFGLEVSEGSVLLKVIPTDGTHGISDAIAASGTPPSISSPSSSRSDSASHGTHTTSPRLFQHCFQSQARPIPHFLHPGVEGPTEEPDAPYTITFTERQYISTEGAAEGPRWTTSLMYIFYEKHDQLTLSRYIFGKTLRMTAGANRIIYNGKEISHMAAIVLWFDDASETLSITFFPNLTRKKATPRDIELKVLGLWDSDKDKAPRNSNALAVIAEEMPKVDEGLDTTGGFDRQSSVQSGGTFLTKTSSATSQKRRNSGKLKCTIEFTRLSDSVSFATHLK